jgi:hypothetical protein
MRHGVTPADEDTAVAVRRWAMLAFVVAVTAVAVWVTSPRFQLDTPSLVDDWAAIERSDEQLSEIIRLRNPEGQRFRPGWILWNYVQWHTLDAPAGGVGPNTWNVIRILVLVAGLTLLTALALPAPRRTSEALLQAGLAVTPALLVVSAPKFAVDLARFGPQEPLMVGAMAFGGSLLVLAARGLLDRNRTDTWAIAVLAGAGGVLWTVGVTHKETSLAVLPLLAAVVYVGRGRLAGWHALGTQRRIAAAALAAVTALPLIVVAIESVRIAGKGDLVYDAEVDGGLGMLRGLQLLYEWTHEVLPPNWRLCAAAAVVVTVVVAAIRRRADLVALAALASGVLALALAGQSGVVSTRYYIPSFALFMVALAVSLARLPSGLQFVALVGLVLVSVPPDGTREEVGRWVAEEKDGGVLVREVAALYASGCLVAMAGLGEEAREALPVLVRVESREQPARCASGATYFVVGQSPQGEALMQTCQKGSVERIGRHAGAIVYRCAALRDAPVRDPALGLLAPAELVELRRLGV